MKGKVRNIILAVVLLVGLGLLLYPSVSNWWNQYHTSRSISTYNEELAKIDTSEAEAELERAREYNSRLYESSSKQKFAESNASEYEALLNVNDTGIMGYVDIPTIRVSLPVYHGTGEEVLQIAAGHLEWTSLPVGGENTHAVLSGHRGLPSARLFTDLDVMQEGDIFTVHVYHDVYYYRVDDISVILPEETSSIVPTAGKDYCTLLTCTPYGVNTHRLLVRGERIFPSFRDASISKEAKVIPSIVVSGGSAGLIILLGILLDWRRSKKDKKLEQLEKQSRRKHRRRRGQFHVAKTLE